MIVGLGCLAHDHVAVTDTAWAAGKGHIIHRADRFGGNAPNALVTIAALGYPAGYLATVGTSDTGDAGVADLAARGVTTDFVQRLAGADPVEAYLTITADGERYIAFDNSRSRAPHSRIKRPSTQPWRRPQPCSSTPRRLRTGRSTWCGQLATGRSRWYSMSSATPPLRWRN